MDCEFISSVERYNITIVTGMIIPIPEKRYSEVREEIAEIMEGEIIRHLDSEHPSDYTFDRMKEMHDYILSRGRSKREHCHYHGDGPCGNGFGRKPYEDQGTPGRRFGWYRR